MAQSGYVPHDRPDKFWCLECRMPLSLSLRAPGTPYCTGCVNVKNNRATLSNQQAIARTAASNMLEMVAQYDTTKGPNDTLVDTFLQTFGPQEAGEVAADICRSVMAAARGSTDQKLLREARVWFFKLQSVTERYQKQVDERRKGLASIPMEDLQAMLKPLCVEMCRSNPQFMHEVMQEAQPDWLLEASVVEPRHAEQSEPAFCDPINAILEEALA